MTETYRIEAIALHEVGVFDDVRIDFPPISSPERDAQKAEIHVFTGPNGCGKSTLLYALAEIFYESNLKGLISKRFRSLDSYVEFNFSGCKGNYGKAKSPKSFFLVDIPPGQNFMFGWKSLEEYKLAQASFKRESIPANLLYYPQFLDGPAFYAAFSYSGQRTLGGTNLVAIQEVTSSPFESALSFDAAIDIRNFLQWVANNRTQSALAKIDGDLKAVKRYEYALERISQAIEEISGLNIKFRLERQPLSVTLWVDYESLPLEVLPDGLKSIISWIGDLSARLEMIPWADQTKDIFAQNIILFLDEIDIHLHPKWQRKILPVIQKLFPNSQIFVSTHSPFVVGSVEDAWIYSLPEKGKQTERIITPRASGDGKSYHLILKEIFDIDEEFGEETEVLFDKFYHYREIFLREQKNKRELLSVARKLVAKGLEVRVIVERELRQLSRLSGKELNLA